MNNLSGRELECSLAKPQATEKRPGAMAVHSPFASGILPQAFPSRPGFGFSGPDMYGGMAMGIGAGRGFGQVLTIVQLEKEINSSNLLFSMFFGDARHTHI